MTLYGFCLRIVGSLSKHNQPLSCLVAVFAADDTHPTSLRGAWYPVALSSAAAFHCLLAESQNFIFQKRNGFFPLQDDVPALAHYHKALWHASKMMQAPDMRNSDEILGAIAFFIGHHVTSAVLRNAQH